jgi:hypothetical protein
MQGRPDGLVSSKDSEQLAALNGQVFFPRLFSDRFYNWLVRGAAITGHIQQGFNGLTGPGFP